MKLKTYILPLLALLFILPAGAERALIKARLDSAHLIMGKTTTLHLEVVKDRGTSGYFPMFAGDDHRDYVTLLGDTIELSRQFSSDTVDLGSGRVQINYRVPLQAFDSGYYRIPPVQYVAGIDTVESNSVALKVLPVNAKATDEIVGYTDVADSDQLKWTDKLPDFLVNYWWLILLIIILISGCVWLYLHYRRTGRLIPKFKPTLSPYEAAMQQLSDLKARNLWQQGQVERYFVCLIDILRDYIDKRFHVSAPEMTTQQFLLEASHNDRLSSYSDQLSRLLELADLIKFARMEALPDENTEAFGIVKNFVESTRPSQEEEAARKAVEQQAHRESVARAGGKKQMRKSAGSRKSSARKPTGSRKKGKEVRK